MAGLRFLDSMNRPIGAMVSEAAACGKRNPSNPPSHLQVESIVNKGAQFACSGPFAGTCNQLTTLTGGSSAVVDTSSVIIRDSGLCDECLMQQAPNSICFPKGVEYGL